MTPMVSTLFLQWGHKNNRKFMLLTIVLAMLISLIFQTINFFQITYNESSKDVDENKTIPSTDLSTMTSEDFELIFGFSDKQETPKNNKEIPVTKLNMVLRGALSNSDNQEYSSAIIQIANQDKLYEIGENLPGGAILKRVFPDHIIIERGNQLEKLYFPETAVDSRTLQEFKPVSEEIQKPAGQRPGNHEYPDDMNLEDRMQDLKNKLREATQEL